MPAYQYEAINKSGVLNKGIIEADSERHARELIRHKDFIPTHVKRLAEGNVRSKKSRIKNSDLSLMTRQLATLLSAGIPVEESLKGVSEQTDKENIKQLLFGVRSKVLEGYGLAQAMNEFPIAFPELYRATVSAGEQTGRLDVVLEKLANYTENQQIIRQKIQQALIYPSLMIIVSTAIICFLLAFVIPKIIEVFTSTGQTLPEMTRVLINISNFVKYYGIYLLAVIIAGIIGFRLIIRDEKIKYRWHALLLRLPVASYLIKATNIARYIHTFGILFSAGVPVLDTMRVGASLITNLPMRYAFDKAVVMVREGTSVHIALKNTGFISPMAIHLIASGEKSGQIAQMMERAGDHLDNEVKRLIDTALTLLEPMVILLMGGVVLFIVLATLLPIFSMEQLVT